MQSYRGRHPCCQEVEPPHQTNEDVRRAPGHRWRGGEGRYACKVRFNMSMVYIII